MTKCELEILRSVVRGEAYWGSYSGVHGQRMRDAAHKLQDARLVRVVGLNVDGAECSYVAIPPNAEWDFKAHGVRHNA